jgi:hypothetical protein
LALGIPLEIHAKAGAEAFRAIYICLGDKQNIFQTAVQPIKLTTGDPPSRPERKTWMWRLRCLEAYDIGWGLSKTDEHKKSVGRHSSSLTRVPLDLLHRLPFFLIYQPLHYFSFFAP